MPNTPNVFIYYGTEFSKTAKMSCQLKFILFFNYTQASSTHSSKEGVYILTKMTPCSYRVIWSENFNNSSY